MDIAMAAAFGGALDVLAGAGFVLGALIGILVVAASWTDR